MTEDATRRTWSYEIPEGDSLPSELTRIVVSSRAWERESRIPLVSGLSDEAVTALIETSFIASLKREEGRPLRFHLAADRINARPPRMTTLTAPVGLSADDLAKLAPMSSFPTHAIHVSELADASGDVVLDGIVSLAEFGIGAGQPLKLGRPEVDRSASGGMVLTIDAPGVLSVSEGVLRAEYSAGKLVCPLPYSSLRPVQEAFKQVADRIVDEVADSCGQESRPFFGGALAACSPIVELWSQVLQTARREKHGGAFVLTDRPGEVGDAGRSVSGLCLLDVVREFWEACIVATDKKTSGKKLDERALESWYRARRRFDDAARAVGSMSQVDGCVVLSKDSLEVAKFGVFIKSSKDTQMLYFKVHPRTLEHVDRQELRNVGARHRSAYAACVNCPGTIVFVLSEDGPLRVMFKDPKEELPFIWTVSPTTSFLDLG